MSWFPNKIPFTTSTAKTNSSLPLEDSKNNDIEQSSKGSLSTARMIKILSTSTSLLAGFAIINYNAVKNIINAVRNKVYEGKIYNGNEIPVINAILDSYVDTAVLVIKKGGFSTKFVNLFKTAVQDKFTLDLQNKLDALKNDSVSEPQSEVSENNISKIPPVGGKKRKTKKNRRHR